MARNAVVLYPGGLIRRDMFTEAFAWLITKDFGNTDPKKNYSQGVTSFPFILVLYWTAKRIPKKKWRMYDLVRSTMQLKSRTRGTRYLLWLDLLLMGKRSGSATPSHLCKFSKNLHDTQ